MSLTQRYHREIHSGSSIYWLCCHTVGHCRLLPMFQTFVTCSGVNSSAMTVFKLWLAYHMATKISENLLSESGVVLIKYSARLSWAARRLCDLGGNSLVSETVTPNQLCWLRTGTVTGATPV